jgi:hypothetical protein
MLERLLTRPGEWVDLGRLDLEVAVTDAGPIVRARFMPEEPPGDS